MSSQLLICVTDRTVYIVLLLLLLLLLLLQNILAPNIVGTICLIGLYKASKEASQQAGFNGVHNFGISGTPGRENWH